MTSPLYDHIREAHPNEIAVAFRVPGCSFDDSVKGATLYLNGIAHDSPVLIHELLTRLKDWAARDRNVPLKGREWLSSCDRLAVWYPPGCQDISPCAKKSFVVLTGVNASHVFQAIRSHPEGMIHLYAYHAVYDKSGREREPRVRALMSHNTLCTHY